jgi:hypothetical protein
VSSGRRRFPSIPLSRNLPTHELSLCTPMAGKAPPASLASFRLAVGGAFLVRSSRWTFVHPLRPR